MSKNINLCHATLIVWMLLVNLKCLHLNWNVKNVHFHGYHAKKSGIPAFDTIAHEQNAFLWPLTPSVTEKTGPGIFVIKSELLEQHHQNFWKTIFYLCNNLCKNFMKLSWKLREQTENEKNGILKTKNVSAKMFSNRNMQKLCPNFKSLPFLHLLKDFQK